MRKLFVVIPIIILLLAASSWWFLSGRTKNNMPETKKKILMVIAPIDFRDSEYFTPKKIFEEAGFEVSTASIQSGTARGTDGGEVKINLTVSQADPVNFSAVVFVGGPGMAQILDDESLQALAIKSVQAGKPTAAICVAPAVLAHAGLLSGIEATSHIDAKQVLEDNNAIFSDQPVVVSGKIITANSPETSAEFADKITELLSK